MISYCVLMIIDIHQDTNAESELTLGSSHTAMRKSGRVETTPSRCLPHMSLVHERAET
jgi:hypothetical protein